MCSYLPKRNHPSFVHASALWLQAKLVGFKIKIKIFPFTPGQEQRRGPADPESQLDPRFADILQRACVRASGSHAVPVGYHRQTLPGLVRWHCHCQCWTLSSVSSLNVYIYIYICVCVNKIRGLGGGGGKPILSCSLASCECVCVFVCMCVCVGERGGSSLREAIPFWPGPVLSSSLLSIGWAILCDSMKMSCCSTEHSTLTHICSN